MTKMRCATPVRAGVASALIVACVGYPPARADATYGPGSYAVPGELPHGVYVARAEPGGYSAACSFSAWTSAGKFIGSDDGASLTAQIVAPAIGRFITHGCTPWIKVG
ncbi:hypothetical protein [Mycobacterium sp. E2327]|uniref:hypothetical protein n=1 Tax=Mycobacterium sp. E2327 TaxID=1834132 RepID=UPI000AD61366|nr:hypothetical protein [Mycobacterium sp. E2327]